MTKETIDDYTGYWYELIVKDKSDWVWGKYITFDSDESKEDGLLKLYKKRDYFLLTFSTLKNNYSCEIREMDVAQSKNYWITDSNPYWPPKTKIKTFIDSGVCIFNKSGNMVNFLSDEDDFNFPKDSISPGEKYFVVSYGTCAIGRALSIYALDNMKKIISMSQAAGDTVWINDSTILYSSFYNNKKERNWPSEDCYYIGISMLNVNSLQSKCVIKPAEHSNFYLSKVINWELIYSETIGIIENTGFSREEIKHKIALTELIKK